MKKKSCGLLLSSLLVLTGVSATTLISCGNNKHVDVTNPDKEDNDKEEVIKHSFTIENDSSKGTVTTKDEEMNIVGSLEEGKKLLVFVDVLNTDYTVLNVNVGETVLEFDKTLNAYTYVVGKENFVVSVAYKHTYTNLHVDFSKVEGLSSYELLVDGEEFNQSNNYKIKIGAKLEIKLNLAKDNIVSSFLANENEITFNKETNNYEFLMPEEEVTLLLKISKISKINYFIGPNVEIEYKKGANYVSELPDVLPVGEPALFKGKVTNGFIIDKANTGVANFTIGIQLNNKDVTLNLTDTTFEIAIHNVEEFEYKLSIITREPGMYEGKDFVGSWSALKGTNTSSDFPSVSFGADATTSISLVDGYIHANGTYELLEDGSLLANYQYGKKTLEGKFVPIRENGKINGIFAAIEGDYSDTFIGLENAASGLLIGTQYSYKNSSNEKLISIKNTETNFVSWLYINKLNVAEVTISTTDNKSVTILENGTDYLVNIGTKTLDFKYVADHIVMAGFEKGNYTDSKATGPELKLDGYGNYNLGDETGSYTYDEISNILVLNNGTTSKKTELNFIDNQYSIYVPKKNVLTGFIYEFEANDHDIDNPSITNVQLTFISDKVLKVYSSLQCDNKETTYVLSEDGSFETTLPFVSGNKKIEGKFNESYTEIHFTTKKLIWDKDMEGVVGKLKAIDYDFKSADTSSTDVLKVNADKTYQLNEEPLDNYFLDVTPTEVVLKGKKHFKLDLISKTFESLEKKPGNWFVWKTFEGHLENQDVDPAFVLDARIVFDSSKPDIITSLFIKQHVQGWGGGEASYSANNLTYTFNKETNKITINNPGDRLVLTADESTNSLKFDSMATINGDLYKLTSFRIKGK